MQDSKAAEWTRLAFRKGYRVLQDGRIQSAHGRIRRVVKTSGFDRKPAYQRFSIKAPSDRNVRAVLVHQLAALQKFGEAAFLAAECVRHLNGNSLDNTLDNIALGSLSDNTLDRPAKDRQVQAKHASEAISRKDWGVIDADRRVGLSYRQLQNKYGISKGTLSYRYSRSARSRRLENRHVNQS